MLGLMQQRPLLISRLIDYAERYHGGTEIVSRLPDGSMHRSSWGAIAARARRLARALGRLGVEPGERVATLAWNSFRHLELYYGTTGVGVVLHTVNPRLFREQLIYILDHAEDKVVFFDLGFLPLVEALAPHLPEVRAWVALCGADERPQSTLAGLVCYEDIIGAESDDLVWPSFDENTASSLCYTSGTTGNPKGVLYSHRSQVLHSIAATGADVLAASTRDTFLLIVPMFHANAWGLPFVGAGVGARLVLPGPRLDPESIVMLLHEERVTAAAGIPTIWLNVMAWVSQNPARVDRARLRLNRILTGGAAAPRALVEQLTALLGARVMHAWGMTETSPIATVSSLLPEHQNLDMAQQFDFIVKQGRTLFGCELRLVDDNGREVPRDGKSVGEVQVRGPWVLAGYFKGAGGKVLDDEGWFRTGDVATMDPRGWVTLTDRAKDIVKSGGEWISSIEIENLAVSHPAVHEAAVIAAQHPSWQERPLLLVHRKQGAEVTREESLAFRSGKIVKWWLPDDVVFVDSLPHTATGKLLKTQLRKEYGDWLMRQT